MLHPSQQNWSERAALLRATHLAVVGRRFRHTPPPAAPTFFLRHHHHLRLYFFFFFAYFRDLLRDLALRGT